MREGAGRGSADCHIGILETRESCMIPIYPSLNFNDFNGAKRLNDWNVWNGHQN